MELLAYWGRRLGACLRALGVCVEGGADSLSVRLERQLSLVGYFRVLTGGCCWLDHPWPLRCSGRGTGVVVKCDCGIGVTDSFI